MIVSNKTGGGSNNADITVLHDGREISVRISEAFGNVELEVVDVYPKGHRPLSYRVESLTKEHADEVDERLK